MESKESNLNKLGSLTLSTWSKKEYVSDSYNQDLKKRELGSIIKKIFAFFFILWIIVIIVIVFCINISLVVKYGSILLLIITLAWIICSLILSYYTDKLRLTKKEFTSILIEKLSEDFKNIQKDEKDKIEIMKKLKILRNLFDNSELSTQIDSFDYKKLQELKISLRNLSSYLITNFEQIPDYQELSSSLFNLADSIYNEEDAKKLYLSLAQITKSERPVEVVGLFSRLKGKGSYVLIVAYILAWAIIGLKFYQNTFTYWVAMLAAFGVLIAIFFSNKNNKK